MTPRERLFGLEQFGIKLGLDNIITIVSALDRPDRHYPSVLVAGTNGKGSVTAMIERGLRAVGHQTGRYTSPHLVTIEERVAVGGLPVTAEFFDVVARDVLALVDDLVDRGALPQMPTFFEVTTAIALESFKRAGVSAAVIEVGLGGRFDATNVIEPDITVITSIDFDHQRHLGNTLADIAFEKAGIIKRDTPVVVGAMAPEPHRVIADVARARNALLIDALPGDHGEPIVLALPGDHQRANAAVAAETLRRCRVMTADGRRVGREHIVDALTKVEWPARLEWLRLPERGDLLIDAAHNPAGARALAQYVLSTVGPLPLLFDVMRDKSLDAIVGELKPAVTRFVTTTAASHRAVPAQELATRIQRLLPGVPCEWRNDEADALRELFRDGGRAMAAGSIFLVGPLRARLLARGAVPVRYPSKASPFFLS
jgi:dihydrofolate synthase/folylpolyglutamate synthase